MSLIIVFIIAAVNRVDGADTQICEGICLRYSA